MSRPVLDMQDLDEYVASLENSSPITRRQHLKDISYLDDSMDFAAAASEQKQSSRDTRNAATKRSKDQSDKQVLFTHSPVEAASEPKKQRVIVTPAKTSKVQKPAPQLDPQKRMQKIDLNFDDEKLVPQTNTRKIVLNFADDDDDDEFALEKADANRLLKKVQSTAPKEIPSNNAINANKTSANEGVFQFDEAVKPKPLDDTTAIDESAVLQKELMQLRAQLEAGNEKVKSMQDKMENMKDAAELERAQEEIRKAEAELFGKDELLKRKEAAISKSQNLLSQTKGTLKAKEEEIRNLTRNLAQEKQNLEELQEKLKTGEADLKLSHQAALQQLKEKMSISVQAHKREIEAKNKEIEGLQQEKSNKQQLVDDLQRQLELEEMQWKSKLSAQELSIKALEEQKRTIQRALESAQQLANSKEIEMNTNLGQAQDELNKLNSEYKKAQQELLTLKQELNSVKNELKQQRNIVLQLETDKNNTENKLQNVLNQNQASSNTQKSELEQKLKQTTDDLQYAKNELSRLKNQKNELDNQITQLHQENAQQTITISSLRSEIQSLTDQITREKAGRKKAEESLSNLDASHKNSLATLERNYQARIQTVEEQLGRLRTEKNNAQREFEQAAEEKTRTINNLNAKITRLEAAESTLTSQLASASSGNGDATTLDVLKANFERQINQLQRDLTTESDKVSEQKQVVFELKKQLEDKKNDLATALAESTRKVDANAHDALKHELDVLQLKVTVSREGQKRANDALQETKNKLQESEGKLHMITALEAEKTGLFNQLASAKKNHEDDQKRWDKRESELQQAIDALKEQIQKLKSEKANLELQVNQLQAELRQAKLNYEQEIQQLRTAKNATEQDLRDLQMQTGQNSSTSQINNLQQQIQHLQNEMQQHSVNYIHQIGQLNATLDSEKQLHQREIDDLSLQRKTSESFLQSQIDNLNQSIARHQSEILSLRHINQELQNRIQEQQIELLSLQSAKAVVDKKLLGATTLIKEAEEQARVKFEEATQAAKKISQLDALYQQSQKLLEHKNNEIQNIVSKAGISLFGNDQQLNHMQAQVHQLESERMYMQNSLNEQQIQMRALHTEFEDAEATITNLNRLVAEQREDYDTLEQTHNDLLHAIETEQMYMTTTRHVGLMQEYIQHIEDLKQQNDELKQLLQNGKQPVAQLINLNCEHEKQMLQRELQALTTQSEAYRVQLLSQQNTRATAPPLPPIPTARQALLQKPLPPPKPKKSRLQSNNSRSINNGKDTENAVKHFLAVVAALRG